MRKKIRRIKRGLAVMLSVCMVFGVAPIQAGAEENDSEIAVQANDSVGKTEQQSTEEEECKHEGVEITFNSNGFGNCPKCNATVYQPAVETTDKYDIDDDSMKETVYEISNAGQLYWFAGLVNGTLDGVEQNTSANAILTANITANENLLDSLQYDAEGNVSNGSDFITWTPIADCMEGHTTQYSGTFDGNNKTVSGLYLNGNSARIGLFGSSEADGNIKNVGVVDSYFKGDDFVGGVCGRNDGTITNCYNAGNLTAIDPTAAIGGICGYNDNGGTIANCYNTGTVTATGSVASVGGVCGCSLAPISNCYNIGTVTATSSGADISGICGYYFGPVTNCYYLADTEDENGGKTAAQFASGEIAYLLSQGCTVGGGEGENAVTYSGSVWGQALGGNGDTYPVLDSTKRVYQVDKYDGCEGKPGSSTKVYSNQSTSIYEEHSFAYEPVENGNAIKVTCSECGATYTVKLTQPAATSGEKIVYDGTEKKAGTAIDSGNTGIETIPENAITYATVTNGTPSTYSTTAPKNAGTYKAKLTLGTGDNIVSIEINFTIEKAASPTIAGEEKSYIYSTGSDGKTICVDIAGKLPTDRGITTYAVAKTDTEQLLSEVTVDTAGNLTYKVNQVDSTKVGKTAIIAVTASMENYENVSVTITITCSSCDHKNTEVRDKKEVTCTEDGYSGDVYCKDCTVLVTKGSVITHPGHLLREVAAKDATATVAGNIAYYVCENAGCGKYFADNAAKTEITDKSSIIIPATGGGSSSSGGASSGGSSSDGTSGGGTSSGTTDKPSVPKKGTKIKGNDGSTYIVTSGKGKTPTVQYTAPKSTAKGTVTIPAKAKVDGVSYRVTSIADNAFKNNKKITKVVIGSNIVTIGKNAFAKCTNITSIVIGKNVTKIEKNAFYGCRKLKKITIKSEKLTSKSVAKNAFSRIGKKTVIKVPTSKYKAYKKMLYTKGLNKKVRILKY